MRIVGLRACLGLATFAAPASAAPDSPSRAQAEQALRGCMRCAAEEGLDCAPA